MRTHAPKKHGSQKRQTVEIGVCVSPAIKAELERLRDQGRGREKLSISKVAGRFIEQGIQGHIDMQYGALLKPVIEKTIKQELRSFSNRINSLQADGFYTAEQTRILLIQLLSYFLSDQTDILPGLIAQSQKEARINLKSAALGREDKKLD